MKVVCAPGFQGPLISQHRHPGICLRALEKVLESTYPFIFASRESCGCQETQGGVGGDESFLRGQASPGQGDLLGPGGVGMRGLSE
jgi:hypothetical protein